MRELEKLMKAHVGSIDWDNLEKENFEEGNRNPNRFSYWYYPLKEAVDVVDSFKLPRTDVVHLTLGMYGDIQVDSEEEAKKVEKRVNDYFWKKITFTSEDTFFLKSGLFSNKFNFKTCLFNGSEDEYVDLAGKVMDITYASGMFGVSPTSEFVFREYIEDDFGLGTIYNGMPLRPEFRYFYDFDNKEMIGVSEYWHPDVMDKGLYDEEDREVYERVKEELTGYFVENYKSIGDQLADVLVTVDGLSGVWSVDVMMGKEDLYVIDMAVGNQSALVDKMIEKKDWK